MATTSKNADNARSSGGARSSNMVEESASPLGSGRRRRQQLGRHSASASKFLMELDMESHHDGSVHPVVGSDGKDAHAHANQPRWRRDNISNVYSGGRVTQPLDTSPKTVGNGAPGMPVDTSPSNRPAYTDNYGHDAAGKRDGHQSRKEKTTTTSENTPPIHPRSSPGAGHDVHGKHVHGGPALSQIILSHLEAVGLSHVADSLREEMAEHNVAEEAYIPALSPVSLLERERVGGGGGEPAGKQVMLSAGGTGLSLSQFSGQPSSSFRASMSESPVTLQDGLNRCSSLQLLMCPSLQSKEKIRSLLKDPRVRIRKQWDEMGLPKTDDVYLSSIATAATIPMWQIEDEETLMYTTHRRHIRTGRIRYGTLNQLIEDLTSVNVMPLSSLPAERGENYEEFTTAFLRQHRNFAASHWVLAKLMERFLVPLSLRLGMVNFEAHGIFVHAPGTSLRRLRCVSAGGEHFSAQASLWIQVVQEIQRKVVSILVLWLRDFPTHFDDVMRSAVHVFIDECCYTPQTIWSDCPAVLVQLAEFAKSHLGVIERAASAPRALQRLRHGIIDTSIPPTVSKSGTHGVTLSHKEVMPSFAVLPKQAADAILGENAAAATVRLRRSDAGWKELAQAVVQGFLEFSTAQYAEKLTASHHFLFRKFHPDELQRASQNVSGVFLSSQHFDSTALGRFLRSAADLTDWAVSTLIMAGALDAYTRLEEANGQSLGHSTATPRLSKDQFTASVERLVEIAIHMLVLNNAHGGFGIARAFEHPFVKRLCRVASLGTVAFAAGGGAEGKKADIFREVTMVRVEKLNQLFTLEDIVDDDGENTKDEEEDAGRTTPQAAAAERKVRARRKWRLFADPTTLGTVEEFVEPPKKTRVPYAEAMRRFMEGVSDGDMYAPIPSLYVTLKDLKRLEAEQPSLVLMATSSDFPSSLDPYTTLAGNQHVVSLINWRKFMVADECIRNLIAAQRAPEPQSLKRDIYFERRLADQFTRVIIDPKTLANLVNKYVLAH